MEGYRTPELDVTWVSRWTPARFAAAGIIFYVLVFLFSPLEYTYSLISVGGVLYAVSAIFCFFVGCAICRWMGNSGDAPRPQPIYVSLDRFVNVATFIGTIGVLARIYDRFIVRGFTVEQTYFETRESVERSVSAFGYVGGMFFTFGMVALALMWLSSSQSRRPVMFVYVGLLALFPTFESLLQGSRSTMIYTVFLFFFFARATNAMSWLTKSPVALTIGSGVLIVFAQMIFELRSLQDVVTAVDISDIYKSQGIAIYASPPNWITQALVATEAQGLVAALLKIWTHFSQYVTHSWLVYCFNFDGFLGEHGWGRAHLNVFTRVLTTVTGENYNYDAAFQGLQEGLFGTAFSAIYYDFGPAGPLASGAFGFAATWVHRETIRHPDRWLPLHALLCFACCTMLIESALLGGVGAFAIWSFLAYALVHFFVSVLSRKADAQPEISWAELTGSSYSQLRDSEGPPSPSPQAGP